MAINWASRFDTDDLYTVILSMIREEIEHVAKMDYSADTNVLTDMVRLNRSAPALEYWDGDSWEEVIGEATLDHNSLLNYSADNHPSKSTNETIAGTWRFSSGLRVSNNQAIRFRDSANSLWLDILQVNSSDQTELLAAMGEDILISPSGAVAWRFASNGKLTYQSESVAQIVSNTADGSDNASVAVAGGGSASASRGAYFAAYGNEHASLPGRALINSGSIAGADVKLDAANSTGTIGFYINGNKRLEVNASGYLLPGATNLRLGDSSNRWAEIYTDAHFIYYNDWTTISFYQISGYAADGIQFRADQGGATTFYSDFRDPGTGTHSVRVDGVTLSVPFTGVHVYKLGEDLEAGEAVKLVGRKLYKCREYADPACIGIFTGEVVGKLEGDLDDWQHKDSFGEWTTETLGVVASLGDPVYEGLKGARVVAIGDRVPAGTLLCTSQKAGYLTPQGDDLVRASTVGYAAEDIELDKGGFCNSAYIFLLR